jgi:hypothetical protein
LIVGRSLNIVWLRSAKMSNGEHEFLQKPYYSPYFPAIQRSRNLAQ